MPDQETMRDDIRDSLEAAWDEQEKDTPEPEPEPEPKAPVEEPEPKPPPIGLEPDGEKEEPVRASDADEGGVPEADAGGDVPAEQPPADEFRAPTSWRAAVRHEHWKELPLAVREEVTRREQDFANQIKDAGDNRRMLTTIEQTFQPFDSMIQAKNSNRLETISNLMRTAAGLTLGTQVQKAQIIGNIIREYGVEIGILDETLSGQNAPDIQEQNRLANMLDQRLGPINQFMQNFQQQSQTNQQQFEGEMDAEIGGFADAHPYFEDVRMQMGDLMEMSARRSQPMSLDEAYDKAVQLDPEISKLVNGQLSQEQAANANMSIGRKKRAATSLKGGKASDSTGPENATLRGALEEAWDNQEVGE